VKPFPRFFSTRPALATAAAILLAQATLLRADTFYWDPTSTGSTAGGGLGNWDTTSLLWFNGTANVAWPTTNPSTHEAVFGGTGGAITLQNTVYVNKLTLNGTGYAISRPASTSQTITLNGTGASIVVNGAGNSISVPIAGSGSITINNGARLTLNSTSGNTFSGGVTVNSGGELQVSSNSSGKALGSGTLTMNGGTFYPRYAGTSGNTMDNTSAPVNVTASSTFDIRSNGSTTNVTIQMGTLAIGASTLTFTGANTFSAAFAGATTLSGNANFNVASSVGSTTKYGLTLAAVGQTGSGQGLTKSGTGTMAITGASTYTGTTTVSAGSLFINGNASAATGAITVSSAATFGGNNVVGGATTISGIHAPGDRNAAGIQTFSNLLTYMSGSSMQWQIDAGATDPGIGVADAGSYDRVVANGGISGTTTFTVSLFTGAFSDAFWDTNKSWTNIVTGTGVSDLQTIFSGFSGSGVAADGTVADQGKFSFSGSSLVWTAVPEPTTGALVSILAAGALLRRRRA